MTRQMKQIVRWRLLQGIWAGFADRVHVSSWRPIENQVQHVVDRQITAQVRFLLSKRLRL